MTFDPADWDRVATGRAGGASWVFERGIELAAELAAASQGRPGLAVDVGCGSGRLLARLAAGGRRAIGVDRDARMARYAAGGSGALGCLVAEAGQLPFADASLALVTATSVLGCLESAAPFLAEAFRCLEPGGSIVVTATNRSSRLLRLNHAFPRPVMASQAGPRERFRSYTRTEFAALIEAAGFRAQVMHAYNFVLHAGPCLVPPRALARRLDALGRNAAHDSWARNLIMVAQKPFTIPGARRGSGP